MKRNDSDYLMLILRHQVGIRDTLMEFGSTSFDDIIKSKMCVKALSADVNQIGEYAHRLSYQASEPLTELDVEKTYNIRNRLVHGQMMVKPKEVVFAAFELSSEAAISQVRQAVPICWERETKNISPQLQFGLSDKTRRKIARMEKDGVYFERNKSGRLIIPERATDYLTQSDLTEVKMFYGQKIRQGQINLAPAPAVPGE